ncbi:amino acid transporter AVT1B-like [Amphibalanus amphitrite]|uniref:amino acid transporter AVT1B-like n=1 Tax=Amphibalanus amphitrite TaxID=1232801 RepID=UPI001C906AD0|nr:amino acid transporter AVT1B-like [Amphibalanus amphitrite]
MTAKNSVSSSGSLMEAAAAAQKGLSPLVAAIFITGMVAGSGMLALANAVRLTGVIGLVMLLYFGVNSAFCGYTLSRCWLIVESRYPELQEQVRAPYPEIAYRAFGNPLKYLASVAIFINQFGSGVVYVLLSAELIRDLVQSAGFDMVECYWILVIAAILTPCTFLGSPKDFWFIGVTALVSTMLAWLCIIIHLGMYYDETVDKAEHTSPTFKTLFLGMATILFAFGGASSFPTIQNDMADRTKFGRSVLFGYIGLICMYFPMTLLGYLALGDQLEADLINSLYPNSFFKSAAQVLFMLNLTTSLVSVISPVYQQLEDSIGIPSDFNVRRVLFRTAMMVLNVLIGETVPSFGKILNLIGGSTLTLMTFILPPIMYLRLTSMPATDGGKWEKIEVPLWEKVLLGEIILIATTGGIAATYSAVADILDPTSFESSCFISV